MNSALDIARNFSIRHNVSFNVYDEITGQLLHHHEGHNSATNSMLTGIGHYLIGDGVLNQGYELLSKWVPKYISLGTMGLYSQAADANGLPTGIGYSADATEEQNFVYYMETVPGFGADGYNLNENNHRPYPGIGYTFPDRPYNGHVNQTYSAPGGVGIFDTSYPIHSIVSVLVNSEDKTSTTTYTAGIAQFRLAEVPEQDAVIEIEYISLDSTLYKSVDCELVSPNFPRSQISYRKIIPENQAEKPKTIDIIFSAMISTGALKQFREIDPSTGEPSRYIFITEAGLWSNKYWLTDVHREPIYDSKDNGLLAGYRIGPVNDIQQDMTNPQNREALKHEILRVGFNQVVQVVWKVQIGAASDFKDNTEALIIAQANQILENAIHSAPT